MQLYKIANEFAALMAEDLDPEMIADTIEGIEGEFQDKTEQLLSIIKNQAALSSALKEEAKKLNERAKALEASNDRIKKYIVDSMNTIEKKKLNAGLHTLTVRAGVQSVEIEDEEALPMDFYEYVTSKKIDKNHIKNELKLGKEIAGAKLVTGKQTLLIK